MILSDYHVHSCFSGDCQTQMQSVIEYAISHNVTNLCFTDHHDLDFPYEKICFELDIDAYINQFIEMKSFFEKKINLFLGIELGIQPHLYNRLSTLINKYPFDFILASSHLSKGIDPYDPVFYEGKTKKESYQIYFEEILYNVKHYNDYDVYGHLDYAIRYAPYEDKSYAYETYKEILDELLKAIIDNNKGIEINTSGYRKNLNNTHPSTEVINRYKALGGEIITLGSDAHLPDHLCADFDLASEILKKAGFKYYTIFKKRKAEFIKL